MGITGLLPLLKSIQRPCNLKKFEGKTIGVDAYGWLHRGTVACAVELATGKPTRKFVEFSMHRVRMLQHFGVVPFLIFDGDYLPSKAATEADRNKRREESRKAGLELLNAGKTSQAYLELQKAVDVTPAMARQLIDELKKTGVQYIVAPYEADAQMVYLERKGIIDGILSEDSDLLVFGAKCLLTKLDQYGNCVEINKADFTACREISLTGWTDTEFRQMAILSGCDYLASISNMGLKTAYRMMRKHKTVERVVRMLAFDGKFRVPPGYLEDFYRAELTFLHQRVFCPKALRLVFHTELASPAEEKQMPFIGAYVEPEIAQAVARGDLNPMTKLPIVEARHETMAPPATPWAVSKTQPQRSAFSVSKKGKPINTFFKPKRVPLAELDINCFTPSPTQQDALRRNSGPWMATPAPRPYLNQTVTEPHAPQSASPSAQNTRRVFRTPTVSEPRPPKRVRLCEEAGIDLPIPGQKIELGQSPFFSTATAEPSPTLGKKSKSRRPRKDDITIFSDDSIEEALLNLPDFDGLANQGPTSSKVPGFEEGVDNGVDSVEAFSIPIPGGASQNSYVKTPALTPSVSATSSEDQAPTSIETAPLPFASVALLERFSYAPTTSTPKSNMGVLSQLSPSTSASPRRSKIPLAIKSNIPATKGPALSRKYSMTPLQRLGANAANRPKLPATPPLTPTAIPKPNLLRRSMLSKGEVPFPEVAREKDAASVSLPVPVEAENIALSTQNGSEDMIIPDSESEGEDLCAVASEKSPRIGLERFAYAAR